jgi:hypothetical protein
MYPDFGPWKDKVKEMKSLLQIEITEE